MEIIEIVLFAAEVAARWSWSAKVGQCVVEKNPVASQTKLFQRKPICYKVDNKRIILWKEGIEERIFQIIISQTIAMKTMAELVGKAIKVGARLWDDVAMVCDVGATVSYKETRWRDWYKNGRFFDKEISIEMATISISLQSWSPTGTVPTFVLIIQKSEEEWSIRERID